MDTHRQSNGKEVRDDLDLAFEREENRELGVLLMILASPALILFTIYLVKKFA